MNGKPVTDTMKQAINHMRANGGKLVRYPGGFWSHAEWKRHQLPTFGTSTIEALVSRELAEYTEWRDGRNGSFPVEVTLTGIFTQPAPPLPLGTLASGDGAGE